METVKEVAMTTTVEFFVTIDVEEEVYCVEFTEADGLSSTVDEFTTATTTLEGSRTMEELLN